MAAVKVGEKVRVRRLGESNLCDGVVTVDHGNGHVTVEIAVRGGVEIESVGFCKGCHVDASWTHKAKG